LLPLSVATGSPVGVGNGPDSVAVGDFNGDGKLDLAVANECGVTCVSGGTVSILLGNGDGTFSLKSSPGVGYSPHSVAVADFNGDGKLDLAVANDNNTASILLGNGDGTFTAGSRSGVGSNPISLAVGDFNGDGRLDIASANSSSNNVSVLVQEPFATFSPSSGLSFGNQNVGSSSSTQSVTLTAGAAMSITSIAVTAGSANFNLVTTTTSCPYSGGTLGAGASCTVDLQFAPTAAGSLTGTVTLTDNSGGAAGSTQTISLTGTGLGPTASVSPSSLSFGNQPRGTTSAAQTVTLSNTGTAALTISSISISVNFSISSNGCGSSLAQSTSCQIGVTFTPGSTGMLTGSLTIADNSSTGTTQTISLSGTGVKATTTTSITSAAPNPSVAGQAVTVNFSVSPPAGDVLTPSGTVTVSATTGESCTGSAPSGSCALTFLTAGARTITASYGGDANFLGSASAGVAQTVQDFTMAASPASETISSGHTATYSLVLTSLDGLSGSVSLGCSGAPPNSTCTVSPSSVSLPGTTKATVSLVARKNVNLGTWTLTFTGTYGSGNPGTGGLTHSTKVSLTVK